MIQNQQLGIDVGTASVLDALPGGSGGDGKGTLNANTTATQTLTEALRLNTQALRAQVEDDKKVRIREQTEIDIARSIAADADRKARGATPFVSDIF